MVGVLSAKLVPRLVFASKRAAIRLFLWRFVTNFENAIEP